MADPKIKICFLTHGLFGGGAEGVLIELIAGLKKRGVECYVLLPAPGEMATVLENMGVHYKIIRYRWWVSCQPRIWKIIAKTLLNLAMTISIARTIKQWQCNIVYTNTICVGAGAMAAKLVRLPHVWHIHEFGYEDHRLRFDLGHKFSLFLIHRLSSMCITVSNAVCDAYRKYIPAQKLKTIPSFFCKEIAPLKTCIPPRTPGKTRCVIVGSIQEGKRQEDAIRAIASLINDGVDAIELVIVGGGVSAYQKHLYDLVTEYKIESSVCFFGYTDDPFALMQSADIVLICSRQEAFGRVTVEGMLVAKPVIGAKSGATAELIQEGFNGLLYTPGAYRELAEKIRYLHENPEVARQMGDNGQQWVKENFSESKFIDGVLDVLYEVTSCAS